MKTKVRNISTLRITVTNHARREMIDISPGEVLELDATLAKGLIEKGVLEVVTDTPQEAPPPVDETEETHDLES